MQNREITFYTLLISHDYFQMAYIADNADRESFNLKGYSDKWAEHLYVETNDRCFLNLFSKTSRIEHFDIIFEDQIRIYKWKYSNELTENEKRIYLNKNILTSKQVENSLNSRYDRDKLESIWLKHTISICKNEYKKTGRIHQSLKDIEEWCKKRLKGYNFGNVNLSLLSDEIKYIKRRLYKAFDHPLEKAPVENKYITYNYKLVDYPDNSSKEKIILEDISIPPKKRNPYSPKNQNIKSEKEKQETEIILLTKQESEFFEIVESLNYKINEYIGFSFDIFNNKLIANLPKFKAEITENITNLDKDGREFYLNRILNRLKKSKGITVLKNKKTGFEHPYPYNKFKSLERENTKESDLVIYFRTSNNYKNQMIEFISQLLDPISKKTIEQGIIDKPSAEKSTDYSFSKVEKKSDKLKNYLQEYGFFNIKMVTELNKENQEKLFQLICNNTLPYAIAMLDYLEFIKFLHEKKCFPTKINMHKKISVWFNTGERQIRGYINVLNENSKEDKGRYTSHKFNNQVKVDYLKLI